MGKHKNTQIKRRVIDKCVELNRVCLLDAIVICGGQSVDRGLIHRTQFYY